MQFCLRRKLEVFEVHLFSWKFKDFQWFLSWFAMIWVQKMCQITEIIDFPWFSHENMGSSIHYISATSWSLIMCWHKFNIYASSSRDCSYQKDHTVGGSITKLMKREQHLVKIQLFDMEHPTQSGGIWDSKFRHRQLQSDLSSRLITRSRNVAQMGKLISSLENRFHMSKWPWSTGKHVFSAFGKNH